MAGIVGIRSHVATLTFNRPEKRNALGDIVTPALREMLLLLEADPEVRVVVLTGAIERVGAQVHELDVTITIDAVGRREIDRAQRIQRLAS